jgi:hypothetical protein
VVPVKVIGVYPVAKTVLPLFQVVHMPEMEFPERSTELTATDEVVGLAVEELTVLDEELAVLVLEGVDVVRGTDPSMLDRVATSLAK